MCLCHPCNKMYGDVEISQIFEELNFSKKTWKIMLLILICRKWNFSTVWESLGQIVCKVLLLWRKLKHFLGKRDYCWFCVHIILQRFGIMIPENKLFWRFGGFHTYSYITTVRCSTPSSTKCGQTDHPNLHPTFFYLL